MAKRDQETRQWKMSEFPCPSCPRAMQLVGRERAEEGSSGHLLTFQCAACGQIMPSQGAR